MNDHPSRKELNPDEEQMKKAVEMTQLEVKEDSNESENND